jgi:hypothetical protein
MTDEFNDEVPSRYAHRGGTGKQPLVVRVTDNDFHAKCWKNWGAWKPRWKCSSAAANRAE